MSCGKKGPPLAPLVKLPVPPPDLTAERRGDNVDLSFTVPSTNTDGTRPANIASAQIYAITAPVTVPPLSDAQLLKYGTKVDTVVVKAPKDPNLTADADDPSDEVDAPEGPGLEQGVAARMAESLTPEMLTTVDVPRDKNAPPAPVETSVGRPLLGPPTTPTLRTYAAFGTSTRGRKGPMSTRATVPLVPPPPPPVGLALTYTETVITLNWTAVDAAPPDTDAVAEPVAAPAVDSPLLPSRVIAKGMLTDDWMPVPPPILVARPTVLARPVITYNVYDTTVPNASIRLTDKPLAAPAYKDSRIVWGENRCYVVVAVEVVGGTTIESESPPSVCETLTDTFPPAAPKALNAISSEGAINLIWEPNTEKDLAGYLILRGAVPADTLEPITPEPIVEPSFKDTVAAGTAYVYAVVAVDRAGNKSAPSARVTETAR